MHSYQLPIRISLIQHHIISKTRGSTFLPHSFTILAGLASHWRISNALAARNGVLWSQMDGTLGLRIEMITLYGSSIVALLAEMENVTMAAKAVGKLLLRLTQSSWSSCPIQSLSHSHSLWPQVVKAWQYQWCVNSFHWSPTASNLAHITNGINEGKRTKYWTDKGNYYDNAADTKRAKAIYGIKVFAKPFFPSYSTAGEYNGILLKSTLVKEMFLIVSSWIIHAKINIINTQQSMFWL